MKIQHMTWSIFHEDDTATEVHRANPSWDDIEQALHRLDGRTYPDLFLSTRDQPNRYPLLSIIGGGDAYTASLELGDDNGEWIGASIQYINPDHFSQFNTGGYRAIGNGYHNYEIDQECLTSDQAMMLSIVRHFAETGRWYPKAPYIVEATDEDGEFHEYRE
jgi:hypothetical protein